MHVLRKIVESAHSRIREAIDTPKLSRLVSSYDISGARRIYLVHVRKTAGTSLNHMFFALSGADPQQLYDELIHRPHHAVAQNGFVYVGWNPRLLERGLYFYGFSHIPFHKIRLPEKTFTVTCLRDPVERVISHYRMLVELKEAGSRHAALRTEGTWLGDSFADFLQRIPREHLLNQLSMFSPTLSVREAAENIESLSHYFFSDEFDQGVRDLNRKTELHLTPIHIRKTTASTHISQDDRDRLRDLMQPEYELLSRLGQRR